MNNKNRAERAGNLLDCYGLVTDDPESSLTDLLTDLMHYCAQNKFGAASDFDNSLSTAQQHFKEESQSK